MNGIIVVDKEKGYTSRDVVNIASSTLKTKKIGHTGTLDPIATGVLVLAVGQGLKLVELLTNHDKEYIATIRLGIETDTLDITGNVIKTADSFNVTENEIKKVLKKFIGQIKQQVPKYSAIKVNGKKLYEYARANEEIELPVHDVKIYSIELISDISNNEFTIKCHVSKGTYIRSLVRDIGLSLGIPTTMVELRRTKLGTFTTKDACTLEDIKSGRYKLIEIKDATNLPKIVVNTDLERKVKNGQVLKKFFQEDMALILNSEGKELAIYMVKDKEYVKPYRVFI